MVISAEFVHGSGADSTNNIGLHVHFNGDNFIRDESDIWFSMIEAKAELDNFALFF